MEKALEILPLSSMQIVSVVLSPIFKLATFVSIFMHSLQTTAPQTIIISALVAAEVEEPVDALA